MDEDVDLLAKLVLIYHINPSEGACHSWKITPRQAYGIVRIARSYSRQMAESAKEIRSTGHARLATYKAQYNLPLKLCLDLMKTRGKDGLADWFLAMTHCFNSIAKKVLEGFPIEDLANCFGSELALHLIVVHLFRFPSAMPRVPVHPCDTHINNLYHLLVGDGILIESWLLPRLFEMHAVCDRVALEIVQEDNQLNVDLPPVSAWFIPYRGKLLLS